MCLSWETGKYTYFPRVADEEFRQKWPKHHMLSRAQPSIPRVYAAVHEPEQEAVLKLLQSSEGEVV